MEDYVKTLLERAAKERNPIDAMHLSQAASNAANALCALAAATSAKK